MTNPSLQWLRDEIAQRYDIPRQRRMDMVSCNMAAKWFHLPLANGSIQRRRVHIPRANWQGSVQYGELQQMAAR